MPTPQRADVRVTPGDSYAAALKEYSDLIQQYNAASQGENPDGDRLKRLNADIGAQAQYVKALKPDKTTSADQQAEYQARARLLNGQADNIAAEMAVKQQHADAATTTAGAAATNASTNQAKLGIDQQNANTSSAHLGIDQKNADTNVLREQVYSRIADIDATYKAGTLAVQQGKLKQADLNAQIKAKGDELRNSVAQFNAATKQEYDQGLIAKDIATTSAANYRDAEANTFPNAAVRSTLAGMYPGKGLEQVPVRATPAQAVQQPIDTHEFVLNALRNHSPMAAAAINSGQTGPSPSPPPLNVNAGAPSPGDPLAGINPGYLKVPGTLGSLLGSVSIPPLAMPGPTEEQLQASGR